MKQSQSPAPASSQFQTLRSWFFWTIGGMMLCSLFWVYKLDGKSTPEGMGIEAARVEVKAVSSPLKASNLRKGSARYSLDSLSQK